MSDDLVERLREQVRSDHVRGCQGRQYSCDCGYDIRSEGLLEQAAARIEAQEAEIARLQKEASENNFKRQINIEFDGDDILICDGDHHRSEKCEFVRYVPAYRANQAESALAKAVEVMTPFAKEAYGYDPDEGDSHDYPWARLDLTIGHLRAARDFVKEHDKP